MHSTLTEQLLLARPWKHRCGITLPKIKGTIFFLKISPVSPVSVKVTHCHTLLNTSDSPGSCGSSDSVPLLDSPPWPLPWVSCFITCWAGQPSPPWTPFSVLLFFPFLLHMASWAILLKCKSDHIISFSKFSSLDSSHVNHPFMTWSLSNLIPQD